MIDMTSAWRSADGTTGAAPAASHSRAYTPVRMVPSVAMMPMRLTFPRPIASRTASRGMWMMGTLVKLWIVS